MKYAAAAVSSGLLLVLMAPWLAPLHGGPSPAVQSWLFSLACMGLLIGTLALAGSKGQPVEWRPLVGLAWLLAALLSSLIGLCQYFGVASHFPPWMSSSTDVGEAFANLRQRNQFATLTNIGLASLLWCAAHEKPPGTQGRIYHFSLPLAAVLLAVGNAASSSRTGLLQLLLIAGLVGLWGGLRAAAIRRVLMVALAAYGVAVGILPIVLGSDLSERGLWARLARSDADCASRLTLWSNVLHLIGQKPWLGWGWGELDYAHFLTLYPDERFCQILDNAHNLPLHLTVELGIPFAFLVCSALLWLVWRERPWREQDRNRQLAWGVLAVMLLHSMVEYPLWYGPFQLSLVMCLGLLMQPCSQQALATGNGTSQRMTKAVASLGGVCLISFSIYAAWDYHRISQIYLPPDQRASAYREDTLEKIRSSWLFKDQVRFAEYTITPLTRNNAEQLHGMGLQVLHFSPEARVVEKLIESAVLLGRDEEARFYLARYKAAYPQEHARWAARQREPDAAQ